MPHIFMPILTSQTVFVVLRNDDRFIESPAFRRPLSSSSRMRAYCVADMLACSLKLSFCRLNNQSSSKLNYLVDLTESNYRNMFAIAYFYYHVTNFANLELSVQNSYCDTGKASDAATFLVRCIRSKLAFLLTPYSMDQFDCRPLLESLIVFSNQLSIRSRINVGIAHEGLPLPSTFDVELIFFSFCITV